MKRIITLLPLLLVTLSLSGFAQSIILKEKAIPLKPSGEYYTVPSHYRYQASGFHFVFIGGVYRVCHLDLVPELADLDYIAILVEIQGKKFRWYCYMYNPKSFEIDFQY